MRRTFAISFLVAVGGMCGIYACRTPNQVSGLREGENADPTAVYAEIRTAMGAAGCADCHGDIDDAGLNQWALDTKIMAENLASEEPPPRGGNSSGVYVPQYQRVSGVYKAYPEYFKQYLNEADYKVFAKKVRAPGMKVEDTLESGRSKDELFETLRLAVIKLAVQNSSNSSLGCTTRISDELKTHIQTMESDGWAAKLLTGTQNGVPFKMYGCKGTVDATQCLNDTRRWPDRKDLLNANLGVPTTRIVEVAKIGYTSYWMRSSPDGRYVGNGGGQAHIDDLEKRVRININTKSYDPGFFPDNSGWTFHGSGAAFCGMSTLETAIARGNKSPLEIEGVQWQEVSLDPKDSTNAPFCYNDNGAPSGSESGNNAINTYQSIAAGDGAKTWVVTGSHRVDPGEIRNDNVNFAGNLSLYEFARANGSFKRISAEPSQFMLPNEGDYGLTPSGTYVVGRVAGEKTPGAPSVQLGYRLRSLSRMVSMGASYDAGSDSSMSSICYPGAGSKPMASLDERFITFHQYDWEGSAEGTSNIFIADLLDNGKVYQVTNVPAGYRALFPHFLANNMLYFLLHGQDESKGTVVATDVAAVISAQ